MPGGERDRVCCTAPTKKCRAGYHPAEQQHGLTTSTPFRSQVDVRGACHKTIICAPHTDHQNCGGHTTANIRRKALRLSVIGLRALIAPYRAELGPLGPRPTHKRWKYVAARSYRVAVLSKSIVDKLAPMMNTDGVNIPIAKPREQRRTRGSA